MKMRLKDIIPPILLKIGNIVLDREEGRLDLCKGIYSSYQEASSCLNSNGYQSESLLNVISYKTKRFQTLLHISKPPVIDMTIIRMLLGIGFALEQNRLNVIDFGGALGHHYFIAKALLDNHVELKWHVVETAQMANRGKEFENDELHFFDDLSVAKSGLERVDLLFSSGALQYVANPYVTLSELVTCRGKYMYLTGIGLTTGKSEVITVQRSSLRINGIGAYLPEGIKNQYMRYPLVIARKDIIEKTLGEEYDIKMVFEEEKGEVRWKKWTPKYCINI